MATIATTLFRGFSFLSLTFLLSTSVFFRTQIIQLLPPSDANLFVGDGRRVCSYAMLAVLNFTTFSGIIFFSIINAFLTRVVFHSCSLTDGVQVAVGRILTCCVTKLLDWLNGVFQQYGFPTTKFGGCPVVNN